MRLYTDCVSTKSFLRVLLKQLCRETSPAWTTGPTHFNNHNEAQNKNVIAIKLSCGCGEVCDLSEGVSQVTVNDPVIQMFALIQKFTDLVAERRDKETNC